MLLSWRFTKCVLVVRQRYLTTPEHAYTVHRDLADIFLENWKRKSPFANSKECSLYPFETDRLLSPQPLVYNDFMYNYRKLQELWFHLLKSGWCSNLVSSYDIWLDIEDITVIQHWIERIKIWKIILTWCSKCFKCNWYIIYFDIMPSYHFTSYASFKLTCSQIFVFFKDVIQYF